MYRIKDGLSDRLIDGRMYGHIDKDTARLTGLLTDLLIF